MTHPLSVVDLFCGAGGLSEAAEIAAEELGRTIDLVCVNHWQVAIATHMRMHPRARHFCQDIATLRPRDAVPGGTLDLLLAAPSCTHHSRARFGMVMPITHSDSSNRARSIAEPLPTITTANRGELGLVSGVEDEKCDILYRMLQPHELAAALTFRILIGN